MKHSVFIFLMFVRCNFSVIVLIIVFIFRHFLLCSSDGVVDNSSSGATKLVPTSGQDQRTKQTNAMATAGKWTVKY